MPELEDLKKIIRSLVVARKGAVPIHVLEKDYAELEGEPIPWRKHGNISLLDFLKSIKTHVIVDRINGEWHLREVASEQTRHISSLVARQRSTSKRKLPKFNRRTTYRTSQYYPRTYAPQIQLAADLLSEVVSIIRRNPNGLTKDFVLNYVNERSPNITIGMKDLIDQMRQVGHEISVGDHKMYPVKRLVENSEQESHFNRINSYRDNESQSHSTPSVVFSAAGAESDIGDNTDDEAFICQSFRNHQITLNNSNRSPTRHQQNTTNGTNYNTDDDSMHPDPDDLKRLINDRIKYRLEKLIQRYPNGIWCAQLPDLYFDEYKITLTYTELGFNSVREFASQLPEIFVAAQPIANGDYKLYDAKRGIPSQGTFAPTNTLNLAALYHDIHQAQNEELPLPVQVSLDTTKKLIPDNVMAIGETVGQLLVADYLKDEYYMEVFVVEVFTPSFFWIIPRKQKTCLDSFMENLHNFYVENSKEYQVPVIVLEKGLNVACIYDGCWHRGIIKTVKPDLNVTVLFYDYGTLKTYRAEDIYYLHRTYACIPAQAIPCGLYNVKPCANREKWSQTVTQAFAEKTGRVPLIAMVKKIDEENNSMLITLTDTTEEEDIHINDWLVGEGMAEFGQLVRTRNKNFVYLYHLQCQALVKSSSVTCNNVFKTNQDEPLDLRKNSNGRDVDLFNRYHEIKRRSLSSNTEIDVPINSNPSELSKSKINPMAIVKNWIETHRCAAETNNDEKHDGMNGKNIESEKPEKTDRQEEDIEFFGTFSSMYGGHGHMKPIDWSNVRERLNENTGSGKPVEEKKKIVPLKKMKKEWADLPLANKYFLNAVNICNKGLDEYNAFLPDGEIKANHTQHVSELVLRRRKDFEEIDRTITITKKTLQLLRGYNKKTDVDSEAPLESSSYSNLSKENDTNVPLNGISKDINRNNITKNENLKTVDRNTWRESHEAGIWHYEQRLKRIKEILKLKSDQLNSETSKEKEKTRKTLNNIELNSSSITSSSDIPSSLETSTSSSSLMDSTDLIVQTTEDSLMSKQCSFDEIYEPLLNEQSKENLVHLDESEELYPTPREQLSEKMKYIYNPSTSELDSDDLSNAQLSFNDNKSTKSIPIDRNSSNDFEYEKLLTDEVPLLENHEDAKSTDTEIEEEQITTGNKRNEEKSLLSISDDDDFLSNDSQSIESANVDESRTDEIIQKSTLMEYGASIPVFNDMDVVSEEEEEEWDVEIELPHLLNNIPPSDSNASGQSSDEDIQIPLTITEVENEDKDKTLKPRIELSSRKRTLADMLKKL